LAELTTLNNQDIQSILKSYDLGNLNSANPLSGGQANSSYRLLTSMGSFTLSVCDEKSKEEIDFLTRVLNYLESKRFPATRLVRTIAGHNFIDYKNKPVYIKQFLDGSVIRELDRPMLEQVGNAIARLHELKTPKGTPHEFAYGLEHFAEVLTAGISHPFKKWLKDKTGMLKSELDLTMARGFIHGDIFWDNLLFKEGKLIAVLDFEEACQYFLLFDLGMAAVGCCSVEGRFDEEKITWLLQGYQNRRPLTSFERTQFIPFLVYAATATAFWRFRQYNLRYQDLNQADRYKEMAALADNPPDVRW
jgi:homoserine kinase type II